MNDTPSCTLTIRVSRGDLPFLARTIPHIVRQCNYPFAERILFMDTAPLYRRYEGRKGIGTLDDLRSLCRQLIADGVMDSVLEIDNSEPCRERLYEKHLSRPIRETHDYRGAPILGPMYVFEMAQSEFFLHFDSDMMLYQDPERNWIREGIDLMRQVPEVLCVLPLCGPPTADGSRPEERGIWARDPRGFYRFKTFTNRVFLTERRRFNAFLPLRPYCLPWRYRVRRMWSGSAFPNSDRPRQWGWRDRVRSLRSDKSAARQWEYMVGKRLEETCFVRADLDSPAAWTLHPLDRSDKFFEALPFLIEQVEEGWFPPEQAGHFDLNLALYHC
ncbi:MAG TPA: hypothetical protein VFW96_02990 [Thermomicrobiales bacterium]|nr:hypothetical protein [Thermomicrobiales bacterium]